MPKIDVNLNGQKFGRWTVIETISRYKNGKTYCLCVCDCGTQKYIARHSLLSGQSLSCGCLAKEQTSARSRKNYVGQVFGELTILEMLYGYNDGRTYCRCLCSCGTECVVSMSNLIGGHTKSCGCRSREWAWDSRGRTNLVGLVFGRLTVVRMHYGYNGGKQTYCGCVCECGNETVVNMSNLLSGKVVSCGCFERESKHNRIHHKDITGQKFGHLIVLEKTAQKGNNGGIIWKCLCDCGNITYASYSELALGKKVTCGCSRYSKIELFISDILCEYNISYIPQARFQDCRNIFPLPFDFYLPEYNTVIEYDGEQHTKPIDFFGGEEGYHKRVINDNIKSQYCRENNLHLIRLPYTLTQEQIQNKLIHIWNP